MDAESHPLSECAYALAGLHPDAFGRAAVDLLWACRRTARDIDLPTVICKSVGQAALLPRRDTGEVPFTRLSDKDKVYLFLEMLRTSVFEGRHELSDVADWGHQMLQNLPPSVQQQASDMLRQAESGRSPPDGFRAAAADWQW
jgi:hypothetical protein